MVESFEISLWVESMKSEALLRRLKDENVTLEQKMLDCFERLYEKYVPREEKEMVADALEKERQRAQQEQEARRRFAVFRVTEGGTLQTFMVEPGPDMLMTARSLREYQKNGGRSFAESCTGSNDITSEVFEEYAREWLGNTGRVTGVFKIDLDKGVFAVLNIIGGWQVFKVKDVCAAAYHAMKKSDLSWDARWERFAERIAGKELTCDDEVKTLTGYRRLRPGEISFEDEVVELDGRLNFYVPIWFDPDEVFGLGMYFDNDEEYINVYANYDLESGEVCGNLEVIHYIGDERTEYIYPITEEEKEVILEKMEDHCLASTGYSLSELRQQYRQEQNAPAMQMDM